MEIRKARPEDLQTVGAIARDTIAAVYPHYYPQGAVDFFLWLHSTARIKPDVDQGRVHLLYAGGTPVGTVTLREEELGRLFVLPGYQGKGYGRALLDFAEEAIGPAQGKIVLDASLPGKVIYLRRGYRVVDSKTERLENGDMLCWDVMEKLWAKPPRSIGE